MDAARVQEMFTRPDGGYMCARWGRPIAPVVFGVEDETLSVMKSAIQALCQLADHDMAETDPELGVNLLVFFCREWDELTAVPDLDKLVPGLPDLLSKLEAGDASQYRAFRFEPDGAIRAGIVFLRMKGEAADVPADVLALSQAVLAMLTWSETAFDAESPLASAPDGTVVLKPEIAQLIRAAYDPVLPAASDDPATALRIAARMAQ
ncbi:hypothetical protein [Limimaricola pyoseonensis]|uniref:Uncharacterized protein n=1 Tax=Limimaricola pyoseonensis TaxID=521013 RepID=A0A1G7DAZ6_9RHOB|nr:hypothetical protein [Limimaricola pyoseonensis]SDE48096.1 hypothetical protein SAMN04488567_1838 [Limimaricola pyoseonensis]